MSAVKLKPRMKRQQLVELFKDRIISGKISDRLPSYEDLERQFDASRATLFYVFEKLKQDGFVKSVPRRGMYVSDPPPHLCNYGLLFNNSLNSNVFWQKIHREATTIGTQRKGCNFISFHSDVVTDPDSQKLLNLLERRMLSGLFMFYGPVHSLPKTIMEKYPQLPIVSFDDISKHKGHCRIKFDIHGYMRELFEFTSAHGGRKLAVLAMGKQKLWKLVPPAAFEYGLEVRPEWCQVVDPRSLETVKNIIYLLMALPEERRPDTLYLTDDNLLAPAQTALVELGIKVPDDLRLACHYNFPDDKDTVLPVYKIGYHAKDILNLGMEIINQRRTGIFPEPVTLHTYSNSSHN